ncbi:hypothetical protein GCM10010336_69310 [Streptomyces goshikiensis]|nr:hypothetical protein GCM10010336_69310 [Streptomyces goshikiensis]
MWVSTMLLGSSDSPRTWGGRHDRHCVGRRLRPPEAANLEAGVVLGSRPGTVRVVVSGEIDFDNPASLSEVLLTALVSHRAMLLVDLERVTFCDCAGLNRPPATRPCGLAAACASRGRPPGGAALEPHGHPLPLRVKTCAESR